MRSRVLSLHLRRRLRKGVLPMDPQTAIALCAVFGVVISIVGPSGGGSFHAALPILSARRPSDRVTMLLLPLAYLPAGVSPLAYGAGVLRRHTRQTSWG